MIAIENANIVLEQGILTGGTLLTENGRISAVGRACDVPVPQHAERIDAGGLLVGPGFVDIHVHGGNGSFFYEDPIRTAAYFLSHGETTVLATLYYDLTKQGFLESIDRIKDAMRSEGAGRAIGGMYMEGPYMNPKYGASPEKNKWRGEICPEQYEDVVERAGTLARVWAIAPERAGLEPFLEKVTAVNPDAVISVGHSEATPAQILALRHYGITLQTHCMNATGRPACCAGTRSCGPDEACLMDDDMYAELICDSQGIHVPPDLLSLVLKVKGVDRVILISDSYVSTEPSPKELSHITDLQFDAGGNLCGSKLTLDVACRNMMKHTGCSVHDVFLMASANPARAVGLYGEVGSIAEGKRANLVMLNESFSVKHVMLDGTLVR